MIKITFQSTSTRRLRPLGKLMLRQCRSGISNSTKYYSSTTRKNPLHHTPVKLKMQRRASTTVAATSNQYYPHTFTPLDLGPDISPLPNRVIMGSMHCGLEGHSIPPLLSNLLSLSKEQTDHSADLAAYYAERAAAGTGLIVTGGISPNKTGWLTPFGSKLTTPSEVQFHKTVTSTVYQSNPETKMILQILHAGRYSYHPFNKSASAVKSPLSPFVPRAMSLSEVQSTIEDYANCAKLAKEAGYQGVELMGSEGYLIHQFLCPKTNSRTDEYGGSYTNRIRFALEIIRETKRVVGNDFLIMFRLSMLDLVENGSTWDEIIQLAKELEHAGVTILNTGIGWHEARIPTIATSVPRGAFTWVTERLKPHVSIPIVTSNRINTPRHIESILQSGKADLVSMARPFLADEEFMSKMKAGKDDEINTCIACNQACLDHAFVGKRASCLVNPRACHELELPKPTIQTTTAASTINHKKKLNIAVLGAGPAGLSCALTFGQLDHNVTLFDKSDALGGQFNMAKRIPGKQEFYETLRYFDTMLDKVGVKRCFNTQIETLSDFGEDYQKFDKIILATGVLPRTPSIPNVSHPKVVTYLDVLQKKVICGDRVAVIGAGGIGFDIAEYLLHHDDSLGLNDKMPIEVADFMKEWGVDDAHWGVTNVSSSSSTDCGKGEEKRGGGLIPSPQPKPKRKIYLMQRKQGKLGATLGRTTGWIHRAHINKGQVETIAGCTYDQIDDDGNLHITIQHKKKNKSGDSGKDEEEEKRVLEVDHIVTCAGQIKNDSLQETLEEQMIAQSKQQHSADKQQQQANQKHVYVIGGAYKASELDAKFAINMGTRLAHAIHGEFDDDQVEQMVYGEHKMDTEETMLNLLMKLSGKK